MRIKPRYKVVCNFINEDGEQSTTEERFVAFSRARQRREKLIELGEHPDSITIESLDDETDEAEECFGG